MSKRRSHGDEKSGIIESNRCISRNSSRNGRIDTGSSVIFVNMFIKE